MMELDQAVKRRPAHHLREGVLALVPADFPDAVVGLAPFAARGLAEALKQARLRRPISLPLSA
jgi:hypothetical protein